jgi:nucleotide-binding universal stress UspA family protein
MTKRLLVALDPDADTPVATRHAIEMARQHPSASVTGLAVIDAGPVETEARGESLREESLRGAHYTASVQQDLTSETRKRAQRLLSDFEEAVEAAGVNHEQHVRQGLPFNRIIDEMRFHDVLVMGETPHYLYSQPQQQTKTLARVVRDTQAPTLVVREEREPPVRRVVVAFDGGNSSVRALHAFAQLQPFGTETEVTLLHVHDDLPQASERLLKQARDYLSAHGLAARTVSIEGGRPHKQINAHVEETEADVVVAGARSVSRLRWLTFGSNTTPLLESCPAALLLHR